MFFIYSLYHSFETATFEASGKVDTCVYSFNPNHTLSAVPTNAVPVNCKEHSGGWCILSMPCPQEETMHFRLTWDSYFFTLKSWDEQMLLQRVHLHHQSPFDIYQQLSEAPSV
jgi:hypothetical protein